MFEDTDPVVDGPISVDHGLNFKVGKGSFLNFNMIVLDTCLVTIGERVLFGPNVSIYGATHPMDPAVRQGLRGPEAGKEVHIEDDVWIGGSVLVLAGVRIGRGCTIGAGSVVTKVRNISLDLGPHWIDNFLGCSCLSFCCGKPSSSHSTN